jgi:hypothetical protein
MADYYSRTVICETLLLTDDQQRALELVGASMDPMGGDETILDGIVNERPPLKEYYVYFPNGWTNACEDVDEFLIEYAGLDDEEAAEVSAEARRLVVLQEPDLLREVLKVNPDLDVIQMQESWSCSKMRPDGFGGRSLWLNRKGYLYVCTSQVEIDEDGIIENPSSFHLWED